MFPCLQLLDFGQSFNETAVEVVGREIATQFLHLSGFFLREVRRKSDLPINLFEVAVVLPARA